MILTQYSEVYKNPVIKNTLSKSPELQEYEISYGEGFGLDVAEASYVFTKDFNSYAPHIRSLKEMLSKINFKPHADLNKYSNLTAEAKQFYDELVELHEGGCCYEK